MTDLAPLTALGADAPRVDRAGDRSLTERPEIAIASVAALPGQYEVVRTALARRIGADAPGPGAWAGGETAALWIGPGQWLVEAPLGAGDLTADLKDRITGAAITEQTDAWVRFDLTGDPIPVLERLSNLDHARMGTGSGTRTVIHHIGCLLLRRADRVTIYGPRSTAGSLHHALVTAMEAAT